MRLWLVRHAKPLVDAGVCYGRTDVAAVADATQTLAQALAQGLPPGLAVLSSPLQRCEQLAHTLCALRPDLSLNMAPGLVETDFGHWEGRRWDDIPQSVFDPWLADFGNHGFGGGESVNALLTRVGAVWDATRLRGRDAVWITHAGVIRATALLAAGTRRIDSVRQWPTDAPAVGQWRVLTLDAQSAG